MRDIGELLSSAFLLLGVVAIKAFFSVLMVGGCLFFGAVTFALGHADDRSAWRASLSRDLHKLWS